MKEVDIKVRTFQFAVGVVKFCKLLIEGEKEFILSKQLLRSATSIGANVREARNAESKADFIHKMSIVQKETSETIYWLELIRETEINITDKIEPFVKEANELLKIIRTIILNTKRNLNK
ncbi:MAG TPA: four helix bundle protein [Ignavibacteria bacterium]